MPPDHVQISKRLSFVLRHRPDSVGLALDDAGWLEIDELLDALLLAGLTIDRALLDDVVATNPKQRFEYDAARARIRARQGHSVEVDLGYPPSVPPPVLYHGTPEQNVESILRTGLERRARHHVHLSTDRITMLEVARRRGRPVLLAIDAAAMHDAGHAFHVTENHVWLTDAVPPAYLQRVDPAAPSEWCDDVTLE